MEGGFLGWGSGWVCSEGIEWGGVCVCGGGGVHVCVHMSVHVYDWGSLQCCGLSSLCCRSVRCALSLVCRYEKAAAQEETAYQQQRRRLYAEVEEEKERLAALSHQQRAELDQRARELAVSSHPLPCGTGVSLTWGPAACYGAMFVLVDWWRGTVTVVQMCALSVCTYVCTAMHVCVCVCVCTYVQGVCVYVCMYVCVYVRMCKGCVCMYVCMCVCVCTYVCRSPSQKLLVSASLSMRGYYLSRIAGTRCACVGRWVGACGCGSMCVDGSSCVWLCVAVCVYECIIESPLVHKLL